MRTPRLIEVALISLLPVTAAVLAPDAAGAVTIDFDGLPAGTVISTQFPEAAFFSVQDVEVQTAAVPFAPSPPNVICTVPVAGGATCVSSLFVVFTDPVDNLRMLAIGAKSAGVVAQVNVFVSGLPVSVVDVVSPGGDGTTPIPVDLSTFAGVTQIEIVGVTDPAGIGWDDFEFTISPLFADGFETGDTSAWSTTVSPPRADIFGHLFDDTDGDGTLDPGEPGLAGVEVLLTDGVGGTRTVTTDPAGDYGANLPAGSVTADVDETTLPAGFAQTAGSDPTTVAVPAGSNTNLGDDGYQAQATVFGHIFEDLDGNGTLGPGEPGLAGVAVMLTDGVGGMLVVISDPAGDYGATLPAGSITADVDEMTLPVGAVQTAGMDPSMVVAPAGSNTDLGDDGYVFGQRAREVAER